MSDIGTTIRQRRIELGLSQYDLMDQTGLTQGRISDIELGKRTNMEIDTLRRLTSILHLRIELVPDECAGLHKGCSTCGAPTEGPAAFCPDHDPGEAA